MSMSTRAVVSQLNDEEHPIYLCFLSSDVPLKKKSKGQEAPGTPSVYRLYSFSRWHHPIPSSVDGASDPSTRETWPLVHATGCGFGSGHTPFYQTDSIIGNLKFSQVLIIVPVIWAIPSHTQQKGVYITLNACILNLFYYLCGSALGSVGSWRYRRDRNWYDLLWIIIVQEKESAVDEPSESIFAVFNQLYITAFNTEHEIKALKRLNVCQVTFGAGDTTSLEVKPPDLIL